LLTSSVWGAAVGSWSYASGGSFGTPSSALNDFAMRRLRAVGDAGCARCGWSGGVCSGGGACLWGCVETEVERLFHSIHFSLSSPKYAPNATLTSPSI